MAADGPGQDDPPKTDLEKLTGTWLTVSLVNDGKTLVDEDDPPKEGPTTKLVYDGTKWMINVGDKTVASGVFKIDATKTPKEIDIMDESGKRNDKTKLGIYELDGDEYKFCLAPAGEPRPTEFKSKAGSKHSLGVSKRESPSLTRRRVRLSSGHERSVNIAAMTAGAVAAESGSGVKGPPAGLAHLFSVPGFGGLAGHFARSAFQAFASSGLFVASANAISRSRASRTRTLSRTRILSARRVIPS